MVHLESEAESLGLTVVEDAVGWVSLRRDGVAEDDADGDGDGRKQVELGERAVNLKDLFERATVDLPESAEVVTRTDDVAAGRHVRAELVDRERVVDLGRQRIGLD